jgi:hypothetical protein
MEVFISWSGKKSKAVAEALYGWLPLVINALKPWLSSENIKAGSRWNEEIASRLQSCHIGIFCLTASNLNEPWINFEAGAIAKEKTSGLVCTYLIGITNGDVNWPLAQFQSKSINKKDTLVMLSDINQLLGSNSLGVAHLNEAFETFWPRLEQKLSNLPEDDEEALPPRKSVEERVDEILEIVRKLPAESLGISTGAGGLVIPDDEPLTDVNRENLAKIIQNNIEGYRFLGASRTRNVVYISLENSTGVKSVVSLPRSMKVDEVLDFIKAQLKVLEQQS